MEMDSTGRGVRSLRVDLELPGRRTPKSKLKRVDGSPSYSGR